MALAADLGGMRAVLREHVMVEDTLVASQHLVNRYGGASSVLVRTACHRHHGLLTMDC